VKAQAKITSRGQITLTLAVRRALGVGAGDMLLFEDDNTGMRVRPVRAKSPCAQYRGIGNRESVRGRKRSIAGLERCAGADALRRCPAEHFRKM